MNIKGNEMSQHDKEKIFGLKEAPNFSTDGLELHYEVKHGQKGEPHYLRQRVFRDKDGKHFLALKGGTDATAMLTVETLYNPGGREVLIPIQPKALGIWAEHNLYGEEHERALDEFKSFENPESFEYKTIWTHQEDCICEFVWKADNDCYILFSTDPDYPYPGHGAPYIEMEEGGMCRDDLYIYYVTPDTARRWAEARGMAEADCQKVFGH